MISQKTALLTLVHIPGTKRNYDYVSTTDVTDVSKDRSVVIV